MSESKPKTEEPKQEQPEQPKLTEEQKLKLEKKKEKKRLKEEKKAKKKAEKAEKKKKREEEERLRREELQKQLGKIVDYKTDEIYGEVKLIQSQTHKLYEFTEVHELNESLKGKEVRIRARLHSSRVQGNMAFLVIRKGMYSVQGVACKSQTVPKILIQFIKITEKESVVDIVGTVNVPDIPIEGCTQKVELQISKFFVISRSNPNLPFLIEDASRTMTKEQFNKAEPIGETEEEKPAEKKEVQMPTVSLKNRLKTRILDLRVPANKAVFRIQSYVCHFFREYLMSQGFFEIHSPKILGGSSEGGAEVFKTTYFGQEASLAQSPQLFKQMALMGDFGKVFEIGPVFRAENSNTPRHLCEFTGLDIEMEIKESYLEVMKVIGGVFKHIFEGLNRVCKAELAIIQKQFPFEPFIWKEETLALTFEEAVALLKENGYEQNPRKDLETENEKALGKIVHDKYQTDFYIVHKYPDEARPFYTMTMDDDPTYTCSYDVFMRGEEIISGAQRVHDTEFIKKRAALKGIEPSTISYYCESFMYGAYPHGGFGTGLERVVKLFLDLHNVRQTSLFPRTPHNLVP